eukprot:scaffold21080_cov132-Skeletonema_dohrnii-CCMP3373.AAC.2
MTTEDRRLRLDSSERIANATTTSQIDKPNTKDAAYSQGPAYLHTIPPHIKVRRHQLKACRFQPTCD